MHETAFKMVPMQRTCLQRPRTSRECARRRLVRSIACVALRLALFDFCAGCDDPADQYYNACVLLAPGDPVTGRIAVVAGTYQVWWVPADGVGAPCEAPVPLDLDIESMANVEGVLCEQRYQFFDPSKRSWVWASEVAVSARCQLEGFSETSCTVRVPEPAEWLVSGTYLGVEIEEGVTLAVQWSTRGEFQFGTIRNAEGTLLGRVCSAPPL